MPHGHDVQSLAGRNERAIRGADILHTIYRLEEFSGLLDECRGEVMTRKRKAYNNSYCYVIRLAGGQMRELTEYLDTALVERVLDAPG